MSESDRASIPIHDGRRYFGRISEAQPSRYEAIKPNGQSLGLFNSAPAACHALLALYAGNGALAHFEAGR